MEELTPVWGLWRKAGQRADSVGSPPLASTSPDLTWPTHEFRALAAFLALHRGTSYPEVIRAEGWLSASTFKFFLRHHGLSDTLVQKVTVCL